MWLLPDIPWQDFFQCIPPTMRKFSHESPVCSGSLWFPGFEEYAKTHEFVKMPDCVYLSLGDTESKAKNTVLSTVQEKTESLFELYKSKKIQVIFELNKGNHFTEPALRTAKGIKRVLEQ